jgi:hypothetical protein
MKAVTYNGPRDVTVSEVDDPRTELSSSSGLAGTDCGARPWIRYSGVRLRHVLGTLPISARPAVR